jgi:hypothetical protein
MKSNFGFNSKPNVFWKMNTPMTKWENKNKQQHSCILECVAIVKAMFLEMTVQYINSCKFALKNARCTH